MTSAEAPDASLLAERGLVEAAMAGDGLAFRRLVEPHLPMLHRVAARVAGNRQLAEDAVQETLTLAFERLATYHHDTPFKAYLAAIVSRQAHTLSRSERRRGKREEAASGPARPANPEQELRGAAAARRVRQALLSMPDKRREAALLRLDAGLSYKEIAAALDSSEGSARVLVHKALQELKERLADLLENAA